ncbi:MAG: ImmA/IrrE family metallo-endopeptidase [Myxococcales bacterium]|nr:ImmA/IrrE family metallo-endopeptidase [Myxococcales bacterium]
MNRDVRSGTRASASQRAIKALRAEYPTAASAEAAVRLKARAIVRDARSLGWTGPPFDPEVLASLRGIHVVEGPATLDHDALIRPRPDRSLEIVWNPLPAPTRRRFSICHEIAHTLFADAYETIHYRGASRSRPDPDDELEVLCDVAASEFLLPYPEFQSDLDQAGVSLTAMDQLRERYQASREAVLLRIAGTTPEPIAVVILRNRLKPTETRKLAQASFAFEKGPERRLRVDLMSASRTFRGDLLRPHKSIPGDSVVYQLLEGTNVSVCGTEIWDSGRSLLPRCDVEALTIAPDGEGATRIAVLLRCADEK